MKKLKELSWQQIKELCEEYSKHGGDIPFEVGDIKELTLKDGNTYDIIFIGEEDGQDALVFNFRDIVCLRRMNSENEDGSWEKCYLRKCLNGEFISEWLPDYFAEFLRPLNKKTVTADGEIETTQDKIFLPSEVEVFGKGQYSKAESNFQYEYFKDWHNRIKGKLNTEESEWWWLRSHYIGTSYALAGVAVDGSVDYNYVGSFRGVSPCFAL